MGRRELRERIFSLLFRVEFNCLEDMPEQMKLFFEDEDTKASEKDEMYIAAKYGSIMAKKEEIDASINEKAEGWSVERMGKVELTILRLAVYEILYDEEVPAGVAINEAVELAKKFGQDSSGRFINAILAKYI